MNESASGSSPTPPQPPSGGATGNERWWLRRLLSPADQQDGPTVGGYGTALGALAWMLTISPIAALIVQGAIDGSGEQSAAGLALSIVAFQAAILSFAFLVSSLIGSTVAVDWGLRFQWPGRRPGKRKNGASRFTFGDISRGAGVAAAAWIASNVIALLLKALVNPENEPGNTEILSDNTDSAWIVLIVFSVVVLAPLVEEVMYRGVILRSFQRAAGAPIGLLFSNTLFALAHWQGDKTWQENVVLVGALFGVGGAFSVAAIRYGRLGPSIIAHMFFNGLGTLGTLLS